VDKAIQDYETQKWTESINSDSKCARYGWVTEKYGKPHPFWVMAHKHKNLQGIFSFMAKLCTLTDQNNLCLQTCEYCDGQFHDFLEHFVVSCDKYAFNRECYWTVIVNQFSVEFSSYLYNLADSVFIDTMLGKPIPKALNLSKYEYEQFLIQTAKTWNCLKLEPNLPIWSLY
jgi:hypothetical protein